MYIFSRSKSFSAIANGRVRIAVRASACVLIWILWQTSIQLGRSYHLSVPAINSRVQRPQICVATFKLFFAASTVNALIQSSDGKRRDPVFAFETSIPHSTKL